MIVDGLKCGYNSITFDRSLGYQDIEIVKCRDIETKIVCLVNRYLATAQFKYDGTLGMDPSFKQINHYGNQNS
jgi:hypothetical protein